MGNVLRFVVFPQEAGAVVRLDLTVDLAPRHMVMKLIALLIVEGVIMEPVYSR
jgi:hypothetical protein